jgi:hypothetical protein
MDETLADTLTQSDSMTMEIQGFIPVYGDVVGADRYFSSLLYGQTWEVTDATQKSKALVQASGLIDTLRFAGSKTDYSHPMEFPRNGETVVPQAINEACYELALTLLKEIDPDTELDNLYVQSRYFGKLRTDYDCSSAPEHKLAGIPNLTAWRKLKPYLSPNLTLRLRRDS